MAKKKLNDQLVRGTKAPPVGRLEFWDALVPGFGVRITDRNVRTYFVMYRTGAGEQRIQRRFRIGDATVLSLAEARQAGREALEKAARGIDPAEGRTPVRAGAPAAGSFAAVAALYVERYVTKNTRPSTTKETKRILDVDVLPAWGSRPIASIGRRDVDALLDKIAGRGAVTQANRTLARLRTLFNWAVEQDHLPASPVVRMRPPTKERARDRALSDDEVRWFWSACEAIGWPFGPLCQLLLVTAQRRDEVGTIEWAEVDLGKRVWTIPREKAKNDQVHEVALSDLAIEILSALPRPAAASSYIFTTNQQRPVSGFSRAKRRLDTMMDALRREELDLAPDAGPAIDPWILHDLRRSAATGMARLNVPPHVVDKILNHTSGTIRGVAAVYNRFQYSEARAQALEAWGRYIAGLVRPTASNVVALTARG